jgi:hypothetical protein
VEGHGVSDGAVAVEEVGLEVAFGEGQLHLSIVSLEAWLTPARRRFTPMSELRDCMVPRLPKQNRQIEEEPRKIPIRSRGKRACLAESSGA